MVTRHGDHCLRRIDGQTEDGCKVIQGRCGNVEFKRLSRVGDIAGQDKRIGGYPLSMHKSSKLCDEAVSFPTS